jgi:D-beta-D-heptose 7-phosphate kinase/D-beta-D-heptose 1-phosphate adenosyltransferase
MELTPLELIDKFPLKTILVVGDIILDSYLKGTSTRLCREAPVPIVDIEKESRYPGGAANTAANVATLNAHCILASWVGQDIEGCSLTERLAHIDIDNILTIQGRRTLFKQRIVADGQILARVDKGDTNDLLEDASERLAEILEEHYKAKALDAIIVSDYGYGTITPQVLAKLSELNIRLIVDAKDLTKYRHLNVMAMTPNYAEAMAILGEPLLSDRSDRIHQVLTHGDRLRHQLNTKILVITLDKDGAVLFERETESHYFSTTPQKGMVGGAGDTFLAAFTLSLCSGASAEVATQIGILAASSTITLPGTATCTHGQLRRSLLNEQSKLLPIRELENTINACRIQGAKIVFTNGCFDLLHHGHIQHLREAAAQGDVLIVGLNTDQSIKRLKGDTRPINSFSDRAAMLSALPFVDFIMPLDDDNPIELIKKVRPDIFVKGGDYTSETLPEASIVKKLGGIVRILPFHAGYSTTQIVEKIKEPSHA